jgi:hypothetical protein
VKIVFFTTQLKIIDVLPLLLISLLTLHNNVLLLSPEVFVLMVTAALTLTTPLNLSSTPKLIKPHVALNALKTAKELTVLMVTLKVN